MNQSKQTMMYRGYAGSIEYSDEDMVYHGKLLGIRALVSYEGADLETLEQDFHGAVDDYLEVCRAEGISPEGNYRSI